MIVGLQKTPWKPGVAVKIPRTNIYLVIIIIIIIIIIIHSLVFFPSALADGFSLGSEWQQVSSISRTLLSILTVLNNAVVWMISTRPPTSKSSSLFL